MATLRERPEAPWALWCGIAGAIAAAIVQAKAILASPSATAATTGFVLLPLVAALAGAAAGIWGLAVGHVVARLRGRVRDPWVVFAAAVVAGLALPAAIAYDLWQG